METWLYAPNIVTSQAALNLILKSPNTIIGSHDARLAWMYADPCLVPKNAIQEVQGTIFLPGDVFIHFIAAYRGGDDEVEGRVEIIADLADLSTNTEVSIHDVSILLEAL